MKDRKLYKKWILLFGICLFAFTQAGAQNITVTGRVTDSSGVPIAGATIQLKGTSRATVTHADGTFLMPDIPADGQLQVSFLGFETRDVSVKGAKSLKIVLEDTESALEEYVVIGYGTQRKEDLTGSVGQVDVNDMMKAPVATFDQAMAGRIAGVSVTTADGQPGEESTFVIRGGNSLTQSNEPLYVVDGFLMENYAEAAISPQDILSMTVLKDASSTAIYGARGANGVIVIETKRGSEGKPTVTYSGSVGFQQVINTMELMNAYEFVQYQLELYPSVANEYYLERYGLTLEDYKNVETHDWQDQLFRTAIVQRHNLAVRGGTAGTKYSISGSFYDQDGVIINSDYRRTSGRFALDQDITSKIKAGVVVGIAQTQKNGTPIAQGDNNATASSGYLLAQVWGYSPVSMGNQPVVWEDEFVDPTAPASHFRVNPITNIENILYSTTYDDVNLNAYFSYEIIDGLTLRISGGQNMRKTEIGFLYNSKTLYGTPLNPSNNKGTWGGITNSKSHSWLNENTLNYTKKFNKKHSFNALAGFTIQQANSESHGFQTTDIINELQGLAGIGSGTPYSTTESASYNRLASFLARVNYNYDNRYLLTASFRADGSSKFAAENRWGYFPSIGLGWRISQESFLKDSQYLSNLKLRASYGVTGNNRVSNYARFGTLKTSTSYGYSFNDATAMKGSIVNSMSNSDLRWESTIQYDLGVEVGLFRDRLYAEVDVYRKITKDLLLNGRVPYYTGFSSVMQNIGKIRNQGLEITLSGTPVETKTFRWESSFNISFNNNRILELMRGETLLTSTVSWETNYKNPLYLAQVGGPAAVFIGYIHEGNYQYEDFDEVSPGVYVLRDDVPTNGNTRANIQPGHIKYRDLNGDGTINMSDATIIGNPYPVHIGGFSNFFTYKNLTLSVLLQWSYGNDVYNANRLAFEGNYLARASTNQFKSTVNRWTPENQTNDIPVAGGHPPIGSYDSRVIEDGSYLRVKTLDLAYQLPEEWVSRIGLRRVEFNVSAQNLFTLTGYTGLDPEVSTRHSALTPGFDYSSYPRAKTIVFGIRVTY